MLTPYDWTYGIAVLTAVALSLIAGTIALSLLRVQHKYLAAWKPLVVALLFFTVEEIFGALKVFGVWPELKTNLLWITHVIPSFVLVFLIVALIRQLQITKGAL